MAATSTSQSPQKRVLATPELLEAILLYLHIPFILNTASRISTQCVATIKDSPRLQHALFPIPLPIEPLQFTSKGWAIDEDDLHAYTVVANPWYDTLYSWARAEDMDMSVNLMERLSRPEASWRRMFVCQPPTTKEWCSSDRRWCNRKLSDDAATIGLRFSDLECSHCLHMSDTHEWYQSPNERIWGTSHWMGVEDGLDVERTVRSKTWWMLPHAHEEQAKGFVVEGEQ